MAMSDELSGFVSAALTRGLPRAEVASVLQGAGWHADQVRAALGRFAEVEFPIPVPTPKPYVSARDAFVYLVLFSTLYISAYNVGGLLFQVINLAFPDPAASASAAQYIPRAIRWSVSSLIVAFPIFLIVSRSVNRAIRLNPQRRTSPVRRWLTYLTLFIAASVLICNLIVLVNALLSGELAVRFILKLLTVGVIAGGVGGYYVWDLRSDEKASEA